MMFDEIDGSVARALQLTTDRLSKQKKPVQIYLFNLFILFLFTVIVALRASSAPFDAVHQSATALASRASALIRAGESIQNDPDDESATAQFVEISEQLPPQFATHLGAVEREIDNIKQQQQQQAPPPQQSAPAPTPVPTPTPVVVAAAAADDETKARNQKLLEERAAANAASAASAGVSVAELKSTGLSSAEKAEEERLLRSMQRRGPTTPVARAPAVAQTPSPAASPAAATPAVKSNEVPAWKKQQEADRLEAEQQLKKQQEEARARAARAKQPESPAVASPAPAAALSVGAAKAEEERLERVMNRRSGHTPAAAPAPAPVTPTASPYKPAAAAAPATPTTPTGGVPEWKRRQQERDRELAEKAKQDEEAKAKAADSVLAAAETAQREREAARAAPPTTPTPTQQTWEPKPRKQTLEQVATELGATEALKLGSPVASSSPAAASSSRFDDVRCAGCNVMVVGGYKNALGKCWHKECWKCSQCSKPLETKFANVGGKPMCVPCATERAKKAKAAAQQ
jgi:hypothetical protein